ncbi:MAG: hypothetical protein H6741_27860 [Alphaproteobacteria bacterium]|nr:hypothetical protein [Alphaproteobacteria bacterium]MCB9796531.1 hypothetical protein [Alphaproteobacteria bacterium]
MSATDAWTQAIESELEDLLRRADALTPDDLWRFVVLLGRAAQHPAPPPAVEVLADRASQIGLAGRALSEAARPEAHDLLDALEVALVDGDDPAAALADTLLDLDDLLTVLELEGEEAEAYALAARAVALVELSPKGPAALDAWAARRLATVSDKSPAGAMWSAVATASVAAVMAPLPTMREPSWDVQDLLDRAGTALAEVIPLWSTTQSVRRAWRAAAADYGAEWTPGEGRDWTTYADDGVTFAQIRAERGELVPRDVTLVIIVGGHRWSTRLRAHRRGTMSAWYRLGTEQELAALFGRVRTDLGVGLDGDPEIRLEWERDGKR